MSAEHQTLTTAPAAGVDSPPVADVQPATLRDEAAVPPVCVVAVGNAGISVMQGLIEAGVPAASCIALNTDAASLGTSKASRKLFLEPKDNQGLGGAGDPLRGAAAAEAHRDTIAALFKNTRAVILIAGLGGGCGTGAAPMIAQIVRSSGAIVMGFGILPFNCEGLHRRSIARTGLEDLKEAAHLAMIFANEQVTATANPSTPVLEAFKRANELISTSVRAAYYAFAGGTVMGLPFSDICALVRDRSDTCVLLAASSGADDRVSEITTALMSHPSLSSPAMLTEANVISVYVLGGANLAMLDINRLVDAIGRECGSVPLLMGAAIEPCLEGVLMVAVIVGQPQESRHERRHEELPPGRGESPIGDLNDGSATRRPPSRMLPPPPELTPERAMEIRDHQAGRKPRKSSQRMRQTQLALDIAAKGRFDKAEPTIHRGEDLDVPTYVRRGVALN